MEYKTDDVFTSFKLLVLCFLVERIGAQFAHFSYSSFSLIRAKEHQGAAPVLHVAVALALLIAPELFDRVRFFHFHLSGARMMSTTEVIERTMK